MRRLAFFVPVAILVLSLTLWSALPPVEEKRVHGTVIDAKATYCEPKKEDGCTGTLTLAARDGRREETLTVKVPLGTPISNGCDALSFGELEGRRVTVTEVEAPTGPVARAVSAPPGEGCS